MKPPLTRTGAAISGAIGLFAVAALATLQADVRFPWLRTLALLVSATGLGLALAPPRFTGPFRVAGALLVVLGWYLLMHADSRFDGLPANPLLARLWDLPPGLGPALAGAGFVLVGVEGTVRAGRRSLLTGALLMLASSLFPVTRAAMLKVPLIEALQRGTSLGLPAVLLFAAGLAVLVWLARPRTMGPRSWLVGRAAMALLLPLLPTLMTHTVAASYVILGEQELVIVAVFCLAQSTDEALSIEWLVVGLLALAWWLLRIHGLGYSATDEYIYFYAAREWANGVWPYRDFFFSHPPLHIAAPAVLFKLFGFQHALAKLIGPTMVFATGLILWRGARRHFGPLAALFALIFFWFGAEVLRAATAFNGAEVTTLFLTLGIVAALDRRSLVAGLWFGAATCAGVYGVAGFLTFVVLALAAPKRTTGRLRYDGLQMLVGFATVFVTVNLLFFAIGGQGFIDGVYRYHLLKPEKNAAQHTLSDDPLALLYNLVVLFMGRDFRVSLYYHAAHYWLALLALAAVLVRPEGITLDPRSWWPRRPGEARPTGMVPLLLLSALGTLAELGSLQERYDYYFTIAMPTLSLLAGFSAAQLVRLLGGLTAPEGFGTRWPLPVAALLLAALWFPIDAWANVTAYPDELTPKGTSMGAGEVLNFEWLPSPVLPEAGEVAHALFWQDTRVRGEVQTSLAHYLWSKKRFFQTAPEMAAYVAAHTTAEDTITGASDYAPLIALLSNRRLSGNQIDTNSKTFATGIRTEAAYWKDVCADRPAYIVAAPMSFFIPADLPSRQEGDAFRREVAFEDHGLKQFRSVMLELWRRVREPPERICGG